MFTFKVIRKSTGAVLIDTDMAGFIFSDQFIQMPLRLNSEYVYGLGENEQPSLKHDMNRKKWTGWARDSPPDYNANLYGVHPLMTVLEGDGNAHSIVFVNSNAQEWITLPTPGKT